MNFLDKIKEELRPDNTVLNDINQFIDKLNMEIKKNKIKAYCVAGGSVAKSTFLKDDFDVDLFVKFDYSYRDKNISQILTPILKKYKPEILHGSRDYFQIYNKLNYEIVPVLDVKNPELSQNVTDMSPMHVEWVKKNIKEGQEDEIRLAKKFCKASGTYGAESYIKGFSGHVIDILIIKYGSFLNLLKQSLKWKAPVIIDPENFYQNSREILFNMNQSKVTGPIIIVDPLLKTRNAASALSYEKFTMFKKKSAEFLRKPSEKYFLEVEIGKTYLKKKYKKNLYIISAVAQPGKKDVVGSKILKAFKFMKSELKTHGFIITSSGWSWNNKGRVLLWFVLKEEKLPATNIIEGPPIEMKENITAFKLKYKNCFEKNGRIYAKIKIEKRMAKENIMEIVSKNYFKEKLVFKNVDKS